MLKLRSVDTVRNQHNFIFDLSSIPAVEWMKPEQTKDYEEVRRQTAAKLESVDNDIESIIRKPDENMRIALRDAIYLDNPTYVKGLRFPAYLPQGKVQIQRDIIKKLVGMTSGKKSFARDLNQEMSECVFQGEWESNPRIGTIVIDDKETELRLRKSLGLFSGYLNKCEHEFYKQAINAKLDNIMHYYDMALEDARFRGEKVEPKLISLENRFYYNFEDVLDRIYYSRARDYLSECDTMWGFLDGSYYTKKYLIRMEDIHPGLKNKA